MTSDSKYFDMIRIKRPSRKQERQQPGLPNCQWKGCDKPGRHKAPKGRGQDGAFFVFCADHVRQYNASYNYFDGMSDSEVADFQRSAAYGHRPTWKLGENASSSARANGRANGLGAADFQAWRERQAASEKRQPQRRLRPLEKKSFRALELKETATKEDIKAQFKALVKRHHPDANGGDRGSEEKLREIIQAYNYLKQVGLV